MPDQTNDTPNTPETLTTDINPVETQTAVDGNDAPKETVQPIPPNPNHVNHKPEEGNTPDQGQAKPDYRIAGLSAMGIAGFLAGCIILFYPDLKTFKKAGSIFHELIYSPSACSAKSLNDSAAVFAAAIQQANDSITYYTKLEKDTKNKLLKDAFSKRKAAWIEKKRKDAGILDKLSSYQQSFEDLATIDTMGFNKLNHALHFKLPQEKINEWDVLFADTNYNWKSDTVTYYLKDTGLPFTINGALQFEVKNYPTDIAFITKYPQAGAWTLLILIFCSFCFLGATMAISLSGKVLALFKVKEPVKDLSEVQEQDQVPTPTREQAQEKNTGPTQWSYWIISLFTAIAMALMLLIWNRTFYDEVIIKNLFFLKHLRISIGWVIAIGCIAGVFCLAGFIYTASMLSYLVKPLAKMRKAVATQSALVEEQKADTDSPARQQLYLQQQQKIAAENRFAQLHRLFQSYFILAAIILTLQILCTGALFHLVHSLDFIKLLEDDWGFSPVQGDFVYLYGGLYSIILLLVYIPAKMRFGEVTIDDPAPQSATDKPNENIKKPFDLMKGILVATSPFLASIVQALIDLLFN